MKTWAYIRVSSDRQDFEGQRHLLLDYAQRQAWLIQEFIEVEASSKRSWEARRLAELLEKLQRGDRLLVAELSRLGRNMLETLQLIEQIHLKGVELHFIRQPELSLSGQHTPLLLAIYSYFAQTEREYIALRTRQALAALKAKGQALGRPKGSRNKSMALLEAHRQLIEAYRKKGFNLKTIAILLKEQPNLHNLSYYQLRYFIRSQGVKS